MLAGPCAGNQDLGGNSGWETLGQHGFIFDPVSRGNTSSSRMPETRLLPITANVHNLCIFKPQSHRPDPDLKIEPAIGELLARGDLEPDGLEEHLDTTLVARRHGQLVSSAGLELYGRMALLRSVVVAPQLEGLERWDDPTSERLPTMGDWWWSCWKTWAASIPWTVPGSISPVNPEGARESGTCWVAGQASKPVCRRGPRLRWRQPGTGSGYRRYPGLDVSWDAGPRDQG